MMTAAIALYLLVALGLAALAVRFGFGPVPAAHHARALEASGTAITATLRMVLRSLQVAIASLLVAGVLFITALALGPIRASNPLWARAVVTVAPLIPGIVVAVSALRLEIATGQRGPAIQIIGLSAVSILAFALASLADE